MKFLTLADVEIFTIPDEYIADSENLNTYYKETEHEKVTGGILLVSESITSKYRNAFVFSGLPKTYVDLIFTLKNTQTSFKFQPFSDDTTKYTCNMISPQFSRTDRWVAGTEEKCYKGSFEVKET